MSRTKLRILGTHVTLLPSIKESAEKDLDIELEFEVLDGVACQQKAVINSDGFDVFDQWFNSVDLLWTADAIQAIDTSKIDLWNEIGELTKKGTITAVARRGQGANPSDVQFIQADGSLGAQATGFITMLPTAHNADAFIYKQAVKNHYGETTLESWAWLFDEQWTGRCGLLSDPAIGIADIAMGAKAAGLAEFEDIGNMTPDEIDSLISLLIERKKKGQFKLFWSTLAESVNLMERKTTALSTSWSPAVTSLQASGQKFISASPMEGYRGWHGGLAISSRLNGEKLKAAYQYMNWWLSGKAGATIARQGYYISVPSKAREMLTKNEWNYWYEGLPASDNIVGLDGKVIARIGSTRDGGSYRERMSNIAVWSTMMDEHNYLVRRWNEFLAA